MRLWGKGGHNTYIIIRFYIQLRPYLWDLNWSRQTRISVEWINSSCQLLSMRSKGKFFDHVLHRPALLTKHCNVVALMPYKLQFLTLLLLCQNYMISMFLSINISTCFSPFQDPQLILFFSLRELFSILVTVQLYTLPLTLCIPPVYSKLYIYLNGCCVSQEVEVVEGVRTLLHQRINEAFEQLW